MLFTGVLAWGISVALLISLFDVLFDGISVKELFRKHLWVNLITFMAGGVFFGLIMHKVLRKQARKLKEKGATAE